MRKLRIFGIPAAVALLSANMLIAGLVLTACSNSPKDDGSKGLRTSTYYGESSEGIVEITFSSKSLEASAAATGPRDGDYYMIKLNGDLVSSGQVMVPTSGSELTFVPSDADSSQFSGTLGGNGALTVPAIPLNGGGTISFPSTNPSATTVTIEQGAAIEVFNPDYEEITSSGFNIASSSAAAVSESANTGQTAEYAVSINNTAPVTGWQKGLEFTGLDAITTYYVWARSGARVSTTTNYYPGTAVSGEETLTTAADASGLLDTLNALTAGAAELIDDSTVKLSGKITLKGELEIGQGVALFIDGSAAEIDAKSFAVSGAGLLEVSNGTLKAENGKIGVNTVFRPGAKYIRTSGTPQVSETIIGAGGNMELENDPSSHNAMNLRKNGNGHEFSLSGNAAVKPGKIFTVDSQDILYTGENATLTLNGTLNVKSGGKLNIEGTIAVGAGALTGSYASLTLTGSGTFMVPSGASTTTLNAMITEIKKINRGTDHSGNVVIRLTQAFYNTALTEYIIVDPGNVDNTVPYTIRGLGKDISNDLGNSAIPKLGVGIWLANNNVTLEDISIKIAATTTGLVPKRPWTKDAQGNVTGSYGIAILLARAEAGNGAAGDFLGGSKNITVKNCAVNITGGSTGETFTGGIWVYGSPSDIKVLENTVNATGKEGNAVQALAFDDWGDNIQVKNNKLTGKFANQPDLVNLGANNFYSKPASAFYIGGFYEKPATGTYNYSTGDISGNALSYNPTNASVFSFYVCAYPRPLPDSVNGSRKGVAAMGNKRFGDPETKWALDTAVAGDYQRLVVGDLIDDCRSVGDGAAQKGFGAVLMYVSYKDPDNTHDNNVETYKITDGRLANIGIYALLLTVDGTYAQSGSVEANVTVNTNGTTTPVTGSHMKFWQ